MRFETDILEGMNRAKALLRVMDGENRDSAWYAVLDDDWPRVRDGLAERLARL